MLKIVRHCRNSGIIVTCRFNTMNEGSIFQHCDISTTQQITEMMIT